MRHTWIPTLLSVLLLFASSAEDETRDLSVVFHLSFDDTVMTAPERAPVAVNGGNEIGFVEGKVGQAADFLEPGCLEYRNLPMPDPKAGTLELWIKSAHEGKEMEDHYYLRFLRKDGSPAIDVQFYHVELSAQVTTWGPKGGCRRYGWGWVRDRWQHIVVAWDGTPAGGSDLMLYRNGVESGHARPYRPFHPPALLRVGCKSKEEGCFARALIDEVTLYNRCLTRSQVKLLYESGGKPLEQKLAAMRERIAKDDAIRQEREDLLFNSKKLGMVHGRNTSLKHWPDSRFKVLDLPVPDKIHETQLATTDLTRYDALIVPGGGGLNLDDTSREALRAYVRQGGGYVGICGGAVSAARCGLVTAKRYNFDVRGAVYNTLKEHPITQDYDIRRKLLIPHASGPLFSLVEGADEVPVVLFRIGGLDLPPFVNAIAKPYGKGRVAVFSGHPEASARTYLLLRNAVMWAAKITGVEGNGRQGKEMTDK